MGTKTLMAERRKRVQAAAMAQWDGPTTGELHAVWARLHAERVADVDYVTEHPWRWVTTAQLLDAAKALMGKLPPNLSGVAGIPRSGMIPAAALSTWLHVPLYELSAQHGLAPIGHGSRGQRIAVHPDAPVLVVDDTIYRGGAMHAARGMMGGRPAIYGACFVRPGKQQLVDVWGELLPSPHLLEWNAFNNGWTDGHVRNSVGHGGMACDFDGVLCQDNPMGDADPGYAEWLANAPPLWLPKLHPVPLIVTYRCDCHRAATEAWLRRWGVRYRQLVMAPYGDYRERDRLLRPAEFKAQHFAASPCNWFVESHDAQAREIHALTGKPVIALDTGRVHQAARRPQVGRQEITTRHLLYHVYAPEGTDWPGIVQEVTDRWNCFNGRKIVAIATGPGIAPPQAVRTAFPADVEVVEIPNDPQLRETASFGALLAQVATTDPGEAFFYCHTKANSSAEDRHAAALWRRAMTAALLDDLPRVLDLLADNPCVGSCLMSWPAHVLPPWWGCSALRTGNWIYAGTFFWVGCGRLFAHDWRRVPLDRYGVEGYLSQFFRREEARTVFQPWPSDQLPMPNPYLPHWYVARATAGT